MDRIITDLVREYHVLIHHTVYIGIIIAGFVGICGCIRFAIAIYRRHKFVPSLRFFAHLHRRKNRKYLQRLVL